MQKDNFSFTLELIREFQSSNQGVSNGRQNVIVYLYLQQEVHNVPGRVPAPRRDCDCTIQKCELITKRQLMKRTCTIYKRNCKLQSVTDTGHFGPEDDSLFNRQQNKVFLSVLECTFLYKNCTFKYILSFLSSILL